MPDEADAQPESFSFIFVRDYPQEWRDFWIQIHGLAGKLGISTQTILEAFKLSYGCVLREDEGRPTSTGIIMASQVEFLCSQMKNTGIMFESKKAEASEEFVRGLFGLVDGISSAFVLNTDGLLTGICCLQKTDHIEPQTYISNKYSGYYNAMKADNKMLALVSLGNYRTVKLFAAGCLLAETIYLRSKSKWSYRDFDFIRTRMEQLAVQKSVRREVLHKAFLISIEMSNMRKGGTLTIGDAENVLKQSEKPRVFLKTDIMNFSSDSEQFLINLATREFGLVIDSDGQIYGGSVRFLAKPPPDKKIEVSSTDGGRHRSAAEISATTSAVAIVVSDDGPITVFSNGKRIIGI